MEFQFNLIYGGAFTYDKKDADKKKTGDKATAYQLMELDTEKNYVNTQSYFIDGVMPIKTDGLKLLQPCIAVIDISATNNFKTLKDLKPIK